MKEPIKKFVTFYRTQGRYNLCSTEEDAQYIFINLPEDAPKEFRRGFLVDLEKDTGYNESDMTAVELADWIKSVYESYWLHGGLKEITALYEYLESIEEEQEKLRNEYELEYAKYQVAYWTERVEKLTGEEE